MRVGVLTVSDGCHAGMRVDLSGEVIADWCIAEGHELARRALVPDRTELIVRPLMEWADAGVADLIITTGGTGVTSRDVTPEATLAVIEREAPGIAAALRRQGEESTPFAALSRGRAGVRARCLILNLPGSPGGVRDGLAMLERWLPHVVELLADGGQDHGGENDGG